MNLTILTGASRGLGRALAEELLDSGELLLTIERHPDAGLAHSARRKGAELEQWPLDLAFGIAVAARLEAWLKARRDTRPAAATLINNAGLLGRVGPVEGMDSEMLATAMRVNLEAPMLLTAAFLRATRNWPTERRVLNISSGAGRRPITGWATYCAGKAALDMFSRAAALDEARLPNPAKIVSLAPGVIDTDMQGQLRSADSEGFPDQPRFKELKASGQLATPEAAARSVVAYLRRADFGSDPVADVRD